MKNTFPAFIFLLMFGPAANAQQPAPVDSSFANSYYKERLKFFRAMPDRKNEIVFLGNSLTEAGEWQELVPNQNVINRGISGDVSFGIIARLDEVLSSKPKKIFLLMGTNDLKRGFPTALMIRNYETIINRVKKESLKTTLIIESIFPVNESMIATEYKRITNAKIKEVNSQLKQLAEKHQLSYIDLHPLLEDSEGQMNKNYTTDGIHIKTTTYILWVNYLKNKGLL